MVDKFDGRFAFWKKYESGDLKLKMELLTPVATRIMKDMVIQSRSAEAWMTKRNRLIQELIKGYDILIAVKNLEIEEAKC